MESRLPTCVTFPVKPENKENFVVDVREHALVTGIGKGIADGSVMKTLSFTLFPSTFPKADFEYVIAIQPIISELIFKVANDHDFLKTCFENVIKSDPVSRNAYQIYETVYQEGFSQPFCFSLLRSDYLLDSKASKTPRFKQVEVNVACGYGGMATKIASHHRYILERLKHFSALKHLPENRALTGICEGFIEAWQMYGNKNAVILFVVPDARTITFEHRTLEAEIYRQNPHVMIVRKRLSEILTCARLNPERRLYVDNLEVGFVYFKCLFAQEFDICDQSEWDARLLIERSTAIKCPAVQYELAASKKVQQEISNHETLKRYLKDDTKVRLIQETLTGIHSLDWNEKGDEIVKEAIINPYRFVLKPQREGGGFNVYKDDIPSMLDKITALNERPAWNLMDLIEPPLQDNYIIGSDVSKSLVGCQTIPELGIFGIILANENEIKLNQHVGHIVRTKKAGDKEAGLCYGQGAVDSPYLV